MSSPTSNGRERGRFARGNPGGAGGNMMARKAASLRAALYGAISRDDIRAIAIKLVEMARAGDAAACREVLSRTIGSPTFDQPMPSGPSSIVFEFIGALPGSIQSRMVPEQSAQDAAPPLPLPPGGE